MSRLSFCLIMALFCSCLQYGLGDPTSTKTEIMSVEPHQEMKKVPIPPPDLGTWSFSDNKTKNTCIVVQFAAQLNVTYTKVVENATSLWYVLQNVPANASVVNGSCDGTDQWITLSWLSTHNAATLPNNMTLVYHRDDATMSYALKSLNVSLTPIFLNGSSPEPIELYHGAEWQTPLGASYICMTPKQLKMTSESASVVAVLKMSQLLEQAYRTTPNGDFNDAIACDADGSWRVAEALLIVLGCMLGALGTVVLVAYLAARYRGSGYHSM